MVLDHRRLCRQKKTYDMSPEKASRCEFNWATRVAPTSKLTSFRHFSRRQTWQTATERTRDWTNRATRRWISRATITISHWSDPEMEFPPRQITAASGWKESIRARKVGVRNLATLAPRIPRYSTRHTRPLMCNSPRSSARPAKRRKESSQKTWLSPKTIMFLRGNRHCINNTSNGGTNCEIV